MLFNQNAMDLGVYQITNSLRFNSASTQYLTRTLTNSNTSFTFSAWIKRGTQGTQQSIFGVDGSNLVTFETGNTIALYAGSSTARATSTAVFRDPAAWYHIVVVRNGGQGGTTSAWTIYVNNQSILTFTGNGGSFTTAVAHYIGERDGAGNALFDGYMSEINYIDGQALTPSSFGTTDTTSGQWIAKKYTGTYGTNGFYLKFTDGTSTTTLGNDSSGNSNNWTLTNFTRAAGTSDCWMKDVPSGNGSSGTQPNSNYCVINRLDRITTGTVVNANLTSGQNATNTVIGSVGMPSRKWYWECSFSAAVGTQLVGVYGTSATTVTLTATTSVIGVRFDRDAGTLDYTTNGSSWTSIATGLTSGTYLPYISIADASNPDLYVNFGQRSFTYTPPSGYVALCSNNLAPVAIRQGKKYMDGTLYTGTGATLTITNAGSFSPGLVWTKRRSGLSNHGWYDVARGVRLVLRSNVTDAETTSSGVTAFNSNGFTIGSDSGSNSSGSTYVAWQFAANGATVSNTNGTISSQVSANTTAGISIVTYTGTGASATIGHGLGVAPGMILVKRRDVAFNWNIYHTSLGNGNYLQFTTAASTAGATAWNSTSPTSSVFSVGTANATNASASTYVAYCFAEVNGFSKIGTYTGNASTDGPFVYCGFQPKFIMFKRYDTSGNNWSIGDSTRNTYNVVNLDLQPNTTAAEATNTSTGAPYLDIVSNGFKIRGTGAGGNASSGTYAYIAFATNPFANANAF